MLEKVVVDDGFEVAVAGVAAVPDGAVHVLCGLARTSHIPARCISACGAQVDPLGFHAVIEVGFDYLWQFVHP
ncbi:transglutaminase domain-containing protein [Rhodosalinus sp. K401]|uniref:transglutaminase domain-containing protein n=1 Tax=Rhodosalinus sp. K401 TaxID=3239195 RepID=UPI003525D447